MCAGSRLSLWLHLPLPSSFTPFQPHGRLPARRLDACFLVWLEFSTSGLCSGFTLLRSPSPTPLCRIMYPCPVLVYYTPLQSLPRDTLCLFLVCLSYIESKHLQSRDFSVFYSLLLPYLLGAQ